MHPSTWAARILVPALALLAGVAGAQTPPGQPSGSGPGGSTYPHAGYTVTTNGSGNTQYWVYQPASPKPASAPLVVLNHGWGAMEPDGYIGWITHLVRRGNVVVYPRYQATLLTPRANFTPNAITAVKNAITWLQANATRVQPQLNRFAVVGHSYGGTVTANFGHRWSSQGLPQPKVLMPIEPWYENVDSLTGVPATTLLNCVVGADDDFAGWDGCDLIWDRTGQVGLANRDYVILPSDAHGTPDLVADHYAPAANPSGGAMSGIDALDWWGLWQTFDGLTDCAFFGTSCAFGLGNTPEHRNMGTWSDGVAVTPMTILDAKP
jgi:acetyl esterase/lipase